MNPHQENDRRSLLETTREQVERFEAERVRAQRRAMLALWVGGTGLALVTAIALLEGCQSQDSSSLTSAQPGGDAATVAVVAANEVPHTYGPATGAEAAARIAGGDGTRVPLPPELAVEPFDHTVRPGQGVEIAVEGTSDVTEMALSDGLGDALPMVRDSTGATWRVDYRVPLRPGSERLPLSVTAKNEHGRWRRVWLFLSVNDGKQELERTLDSTGTDVPR